MADSDDRGVFEAGREMGALTEAVRALQGRFVEFEQKVSKRCSDCTLSTTLNTVRDEVADHEKRIRWVERKMYGAIAATGLLVYALDKIVVRQ